MEQILRQLVQGLTLPQAQARHAFDEIFAGRANESQVGAMLALIAARGPTVEELVGGALAMRERSTRIPTEGLDQLGVLIDTCGTGGALKTFNISTAAAIVSAAARGNVRVLVAKHGGRSRTGRGSAEVLERLGVNVSASPSVQRRCLEEAGVCFAYAVHHHPAMKFAAAARKSLGFPTIFNLLGPLTNPAGANRQLIGVYDAKHLEPLCEALATLKCERAMVVHSLDGLDELATTTPTLVCQMRGAHLPPRTLPNGGSAEGFSAVVGDIEQFDAATLGLPRVSLADLQRAATLEGAADQLRRILDAEPGPCRDIVALNAAAALVVADAAADLAEGLQLAREAIDSGRARETLSKLISTSNVEKKP